MIRHRVRSFCTCYLCVNAPQPSCWHNQQINGAFHITVPQFVTLLQDEQCKSAFVRGYVCLYCQRPQKNLFGQLLFFLSFSFRNDFSVMLVKWLTSSWPGSGWHTAHRGWSALPPRSPACWSHEPRCSQSSQGWHSLWSARSNTKCLLEVLHHGVSLWRCFIFCLISFNVCEVWCVFDQKTAKISALELQRLVD